MYVQIAEDSLNRNSGYSFELVRDADFTPREDLNAYLEAHDVCGEYEEIYR